MSPVERIGSTTTPGAVGTRYAGFAVLNPALAAASTAPGFSDSLGNDFSPPRQPVARIEPPTRTNRVCLPMVALITQSLVVPDFRTNVSRGGLSVNRLPGGTKQLRTTEPRRTTEVARTGYNGIGCCLLFNGTPTRYLLVCF